MSDTSFLLSREVERLVNAPYAPSLQDLYGLTQQASSNAVISWVFQKPCQVGPLVDVLVDGLSRSRSALPLITVFAQAQEFRDSLLQRYPYLLDQFLRQAVEGNEADCLSVCLSLLSSPLPNDTITPANLAVFVMQIIERMRVKPCVETIRPLYLISSCLQAAGTFSELPHEVMSCFQTELTNTLRNVEDHMGNLLCLATFARLVISQSGCSQAEGTVNNQPWLQSMKHFFGPKRGLKTLDLVVLRVILACSSSCGNLTTEESAESIRLAISICESVDKKQRERWIEGNSVKVAKLREKITRNGIDHSVRVLGISFLIALVPATSLPPDLARLSLEWMVSEDASAVLEILPAQVIPLLVGAHAAHLGQSALDKVLPFVISSVSTSPTNILSLAKLRISKLMLQGLRTSNLQSTVKVSEQYCNAVNNLMESFPRQPSDSECGGAIICYRSAMRLENDLLSDLLAFWAEAALPRSMGEWECSSATAPLTSFLNRSKLLLSEPECISSKNKPLESRTAISYLKMHQTTDPPRNDWRNGMREIMIANSRVLSDSIMQKVEDICYDMEQRCGSIEAPLRVAEEERTKYYLEAEQLKEQNCGLESQLHQATSTIAELQEEISRLSGQANSATGRADELAASLAQARHELEELQHTSQKILSTERESFRSRELDIIASLTEREERLDELREEIKCRTGVTDDLTEKLATASHDKVALTEEIAALKNEVSTLLKELEENRISITQKDDTVEQLKTEQKSADELTKDLQNKLLEEASKAERLGAALRDITERSNLDLEELRRQSEAEASRMAEEAAERRSEIESLQSIIHKSRSDAMRELQTKEKRIQHLERKVQHLREERAAKAREFSEAQQHISRLMGVMGFKPPAPTEHRVSSKQRSRPSSEQPQAATTQTQTESGAMTFESHEEDPLATSIEFATPRPGGRSPKRPRNNAFPSAQPSPPRSQESIKNPRESVFRSSRKRLQERKPLGETDQNSQNSQGTELLSCSRRESFQDSQLNRPDQNHLDDIDLDLDLEFSKDFVFTSTSMSELNGHART
ncbi:uncharacterized protein DSM5745_02848 [Aspergillus mulundensis]|uniref:Uncharacterized protein n=1 Tax=Aspergillus mulundensis TaxID=1810919 RepID=A0A3D8SIU1_9EURO|nr:Uncharacterized protein DSM5745_02848 [Aspergillus mulundensis]RDW86206.1 Uncharacterized protein DSM5745_02848 [Aspergillus mulundensis]